MGYDYVTVQLLAAELGESLTGRTILAAGSGRGELGFSCDRRQHVRVRPGASGYLALRSEPLPRELDLRDGPERYLVESVVDQVEGDRRDRLVRFRLARPDRSGAASYGQLVVELVHPRIQAVLCSEKTGVVLGVWSGDSRSQRGRRIAVGQEYPRLAGSRRLVPGQDGPDRFAAVVGAARGPMEQLLAAHLAGVDRHVARELLHRAGLSPEVQAEEMDPGGVDQLWWVAAGLGADRQPGAGYVWHTADRRWFSGLEPTHLRVERTRCSSVSEAVLRAQEPEGAHRLSVSEELVLKLRRGLRVLERRRQALHQDLEETGRAADLERQGSILLAHLGQVPSGADAVELPDLYDPTGQGTVRIGLDPDRTAADNGRELLKRARKLQRRLLVVPGRLELAQARMAQAEEFLRRLEEDDHVGGTEVQEWLEAEGLAQHQRKGQPGPAQAHPRRYRTSDGWSVWAGRNNRENDQLTHRLAAQNDLWFHAHGYAGAHVVLRREGRKDEPSARTLEEVAGVAAYWSKGKTARKVPVVYTLVKHVSKPRGAAPGQALLKREKTVMVRPQLLQEDDA
jgi:predicted ribosome quality control (RQC) complex YloA/Tae2 family protein